ncbi:MAG: MbnP family protein [Saprospiraceae bacterium]
MKKIIQFATVICVLIISSCTGDDAFEDTVTTTVDMNVVAEFGGEPLQMQKEYTLCDGKKVIFTEVNLYLSDIVLLNETDPETPVTELKEIEYVELSVTDASEAAAGQLLKYENVPVGTYNGVQMGLGVIADLNRTKPEDYGSSSPLAKNSHYWAMTNSYIFAKITGYVDMDGDGEIVQGGANTEGFTYHIGSDPTYTEAQVLKPIALIEAQDATFKLIFEFSSVFETSSDVFDGDTDDDCLDVATYRSAHTDDLELGTGMMKNLANSVEIDL